MSLLAVLAVGCTRSATPPPAATSDPSKSPARLEVFVVSYPLEYFARRIGYDLIRVTFPVPEDQDPAYWEPDGDQIAEIQSADLVLLNGADFAKWTLRATLPWSRTVVTCEGLEDLLIEIPDAVVHSHGPEGEHSHAGIVSETWMDPGLAQRQARAICDALCKLAPEYQADFEAGYSELEQDLQALADEWDETVEAASVRWLSDKPRFHYLLGRSQLTPEVLHWESAETIDAPQWETLASRLEGAPAVMLWSTAPLPATRERLLEVGVQSVVLDTAAQTPGEGDFLSAMRGNIATVRSVLATDPESAGTGE